MNNSSVFIISTLDTILLCILYSCITASRYVKSKYPNIFEIELTRNDLNVTYNIIEKIYIPNG